MKMCLKSRVVLAGAMLLLLMVSGMACSRSASTSDAKTPATSGIGMSPDDQVKQHRLQQGGQTATPGSPSGTSSGQ